MTTETAAARNPSSLDDYEAHLTWLLDRTDLTADERCAGLRSAHQAIGRVAWTGDTARAAYALRIRYRAEIDRLEAEGADWCAGFEAGIAAGKFALGRARV